ncbi:beta-galactosidase [Microbacterium sp. RU33B]|uniref:beta-galactosidase n=1 Tax=Microbacterium sp. RU33B TaxID=1907390 RepID=UPI000959C9D7|nr:beta-galactosidase [Microbacterium sp. RU33B]SIT86911.1 beta-galactosidase [Microbacterium sp. RU33B]
MARLGTTVGLGVAYYNEYLPDPSRLDEDLRLMVAAGIRCIRVGESVWSTWEPEDGLFDLEWMTPILDAAHAHGIEVILGTPTYAVPPWLARAHPELAVQRADGSRVPWGGRQEVDFTSPVFRRYAERVIRAVVGRHGRHPAVAGVQLDNEAGLHLIHNDDVVAAFRRWLEARYGTPAALNEAWGLTYWSHRISAWDELWAPAGNTTPAYALAWRRFQAAQTTDFLAWQAGIVRPLVSADAVITTCIAYGRPAMDDVAVGGVLDIASGNAYYAAQDSLALAHTAQGDEWFADDVAQLVLMADRMRATRDAPFLVTETGATSIGAAHQTRPPYAGQLAQAAWLLVARGARLVSYWHWHTLHSGHEAHWGGVLGHDLRPGRVYREIAALGAQFSASAEWLADAEAEADVAIVIAHDSDWVMAAEPPLCRVDGSADPRSYGRIVQAFARGVVDAGRQLAVVNERQIPDAAALVSRFGTVIVPGLVAASDRTLSVLVEFVGLGGTLVVGPRTGFGDDSGRVRTSVAPGVLAEVLGASYAEFAALRGDVVVDGLGGGVAQGWIDAYEPEGAEVLAGYAHPHYGAWAAVTRHAFGAGTAYAVGTLLDRALMARVVVDASAPRIVSPLRDRPDSVTVHSLSGPRGRVWVVHNWTPDEVEVETVRDVADALAADAPLPAGSVLPLAPWGVAVWGEALP